MAVDVFLKLDGIDGESTADGKTGQINILSYSWGVSNSSSFDSSGGGGAGKSSFSDLSCMMTTNKASVKLEAACAQGTHIASGILTARKAGKDQKDFYVVTLTDILVTSFQHSASSEIPTESFSLAYAKIKVEYFTQAKDGSVTPAGKFEYDVQKVKGT